ncbi:CDC48 like AAA ATPase [Cryptosporidium ubiquitum]|uniref:CDC48 like AAA ATPase n=1 Tax=Cryptosporidium ubiquitum TaxID=857276 RepID=A0A1J4MGL6_9CRYT|nr:CDC48 like AAA ATPase [Cryptosporidium ubiquitum]OII71997.1 CDC48 like AAA ATPase [Cryptosporidium ubiquitum]
MKNKQKHKNSLKNSEDNESIKIEPNIKIPVKWPYLLNIVFSKDISRSNILELRVSETTLNQMTIANGTLCVLRYFEKSLCVTIRSLEPNVKFGDNQGLIGELVINNLNIIDENIGQLEIIPFRSFAKDMNINTEMNKHCILKFFGILDINSSTNNSMKNLLKSPPEYINDNKSIQQMIISRSRGTCVFQGNIIPIQIASMVYYFNVFEFDKNQEFLENYSKIVKIGNQTKIELVFENKLVDIKQMNKNEENIIKNDINSSIKGQRKYGMDKIGGMKQLKDEINKCIINPLKFSKIYSSFGIKPSKGILLYGPPGTGKTLIARSIAEEIELIETFEQEESGLELSVDFIVIDGSNISNSTGDEDNHFFKCIQKVKDNSKKEKIIYSILFIDEIDMICGNRDSFSGINDQNKKYLTAILSLLDGFDDNNRVILIATTNKPNEIDPALRRAGRIDREIAVEVPNSLERREIIELILSEIPNSLNDSEIDSLVNETQAFVGADLKMLINESINTFLERTTKLELIDNGKSLLLSFEDIHNSVKNIKPSALRELAIEIPKTHWSDIGGYEEVKEQLKECVEWPLIHSDLFEYMKIKPPSGVLLYGPPGCSKTLMAKAVATESKMNFISVKGPELFSKWVGESEKSIREIFRKARQNSPCIIFFDEIDAIGVNRESTSNTSDVSTRVLSQMLNEMDGITTNKQVIVIGATNRPDLLDSALLRPGRLDRIIYIGLPNSKARKKILNIYLKSTNYIQNNNKNNNKPAFERNLISENLDNSKIINNKTKDSDITELCSNINNMEIFDNYDEMIDLLVNLTNGYSGAELALLCRETMMQVIRRTITNNFDSIKDSISNHIMFTWEDILFALDKVKPRIPNSLIEFYENYNKKNNII